VGLRDGCANANCLGHFFTARLEATRTAAMPERSSL
jgi:hypothetical protein